MNTLNVLTLTRLFLASLCSVLCLAAPSKASETDCCCEEQDECCDSWKESAILFGGISLIGGVAGAIASNINRGHSHHHHFQFPSTGPTGATGETGVTGPTGGSPFVATEAILTFTLPVSPLLLIFDSIPDQNVLGTVTLTAFATTPEGLVIEGESVRVLVDPNIETNTANFTALAPLKVTVQQGDVLPGTYQTGFHIDTSAITGAIQYVVLTPSGKTPYVEVDFDGDDVIDATVALSPLNYPLGVIEVNSDIQAETDYTFDPASHVVGL